MKKPKKSTAKKASTKKPNKKSNAKKQKSRKTRNSKDAEKVRKRPKAKSRVSRPKSKAKVPAAKQLRPKKSTAKNVDKRKVSISSQRRGSGSKKPKQIVKATGGTNKKLSGKLEVSKQTKKTAKEIHYTFSGVRAVHKKIDLFKAKGKTAIEKQLKKFGGKPPRGLIVLVSDKKGREKAEVSPLDFVVNEENTQKFISDLLDRMKVDFMEWKDMQDNDEPGDDLDVNPYADFNPDTVSEITIKFIY